MILKNKIDMTHKILNPKKFYCIPIQNLDDPESEIHFHCLDQEEVSMLKRKSNSSVIEIQN